MFRALFWTTVGFVGGLLFGEWLAQREEQKPVLERPSAATEPTFRPANIPLPAEPPKTAPEPAQAAPHVELAPSEKSAEDDLTTIKGIGPTFAKRLKEAGIKTFKQVAEAAPERLREITKIRDWQRPSAEEWIEEAQSLS